jgi:hypothetical protein
MIVPLFASGPRDPCCRCSSIRALLELVEVLRMWLFAGDLVMEVIMVVVMVLVVVEVVAMKQNTVSL